MQLSIGEIITFDHRIFLIAFLIFVVAGSTFVVFLAINMRRRVAEIKYKSLFENLVSGLFIGKCIFDTKGAVCNVQCLEMNLRLEKYLGFDKHVFEGKTLTQIWGTVSSLNVFFGHLEHLSVSVCSSRL